MQLAVAHLTGSISRLAGGPFESVRRAAQELARQGCRVTVASPGGQHSGEGVAGWAPVKLVVLEAMKPRSFGYSTGWRKFLKAEAPDVVHVQGLWMAQGPVALAWRRRTGRPYLVSPRGMLKPWALKYRGWKKQLALWAWERRVLDGAACLHATSEEEAVQLRLLGLKRPIAIIPNGVDVPPTESAGRSGPNDRVAVFLSRIHPIKGLPMLLNAWATVRPAGWRLVIAGPDECGHEAELRKTVSELGLGNQVEFHGPVYDEAKWNLLRGADLFVLPTYSENFGIAVAEALASGLPAITTTGTPWRMLVDERCGWWVEPTSAALGDALRVATSLPALERRRMGARGRELVQERFGWPEIARKMLSVYLWVARGGARPSSVRAD